ncbi:MAG TPA: glycosyltransferase family 2 protein [Chitinophagales bacterium]|nr:glycosyltransferase family 2 protein [Chitinophagales bacterium]
MDAPLNPIITAIVPVYNAELYLQRCIDSIVNQSEKRLELILVDDLSTDKSQLIMKEAQEKYEFVTTIVMAKKGYAGGARNAGLKVAKGKYISFIDCDDWIDTNMYKNSIDLMDRTMADVGVCGVITEYPSPFDSTYRYFYKIENVIEGKLALNLMCRQYNQDLSISPLMGNKIFRLDFLNQNRLKFVENCFNDDDVFNYLSFLHADKVVITPNSFLHYFQQEHSITHSFSKKHIDDLLHAFKIIRTVLEEKELYELQLENYYPFFEKCLSFILQVLQNVEPDRKIQNEYLQYFYSKCTDTQMMSEYIQYLGLSRVRRFLNPSITL